MCEFCTQHGEGKKWYLNVKNYSNDLLHDPKRVSMIRNFYKENVDEGSDRIKRMENIFYRNPKTLDRIKGPYIKEMKAKHYGQVIPLEEVEKVFSFCNTAVRLPCGCRWAFNKKEERVCFGISFDGPAWIQELDFDYFGKPDVGQFDSVNLSQAAEIIKNLDKQGMVHSIWTFQTPFIGALCNCELKSCLAMRSTIGLQMPTMFRSEMLAGVDAGKCTGCQECISVCQFNAIEFIVKDNISGINPVNCFGCGVCRASCPEGAIYLEDRGLHPEASAIW